MTAPTPYELYRVVTDYEALQDGFLDRIEDLNTTFEQIEEAGGLTRGYAAKLLFKSQNRVTKALGPHSLGQMLKGTGLVLALVVDDERFAPLKNEMTARKRPPVRTIVRNLRPKWLFNSAKGSKTRKKAWESVPPEMRKKMMRKVAKARWKKRRKSLISEVSAAIVLQAPLADCPECPSTSAGSIGATRRPGARPPLL